MLIEIKNSCERSKTYNVLSILKSIFIIIAICKSGIIARVAFKLGGLLNANLDSCYA